VCLNSYSKNTYDSVSVCHKKHIYTMAKGLLMFFYMIPIAKYYSQLKPALEVQNPPRIYKP